MKRILAIFLMTVLCFSLVACGTRGQTENSESAEQDTETSEISTGNSEETIGNEANETAALPTESTERPDNEQSDEPSQMANTLVVYFSATGTTKGVAETIASVAGADLYEITPVQPYSSDDLNYNDNNSRTTKEQNERKVRPEISGTIENWDSYSVVYLGYPIWWGEEPRILDTFVESYSFESKTVIPFCTSGGSEVGSSDSNLEKQQGRERR